MKLVTIWDKVAVDFGKVGPKYWNDFGNRLVELSRINKGAKVLDIGMGRGASLFAAIDKIGKDGYAVGIDNSKVMVSETHKDILNKKICNAEVKNMNAQNLNFDSSKIAPPSIGSSLHKIGPSKSIFVIIFLAAARWTAAFTLTFASSIQPIIHSTP